jgi:hypothetical protein
MLIDVLPARLKERTITDTTEIPMSEHKANIKMGA